MGKRPSDQRRHSEFMWVRDAADGCSCHGRSAEECNGWHSPVKCGVILLVLSIGCVFRA